MRPWNSDQCCAGCRDHLHQPGKAEALTILISCTTTISHSFSGLWVSRVVTTYASSGIQMLPKTGSSVSKNLVSLRMWPRLECFKIRAVTLWTYIDNGWSGGRIQSRKLVFGFFAHHLAILCVALNLFRYFIRRINLPRLQSAYLYSWISNDQFLVSVLSFYIIERGHSGWHNGCLLRYVVNSATCSHADPYHGHWIPASPVQQVFIRWNTVGESFVSILGKSQCGRLKSSLRCSYCMPWTF